MIVTPDRARRAISLVDLTNLDDDCRPEDVDVLCGRAVEHGTAAVCVWPDFVARANDRVHGTDVRVATVVNFPTGSERRFAVELVTDRALDDGAHEIDVVLPYTSFAAGDVEHAAEMIRAIRATTADRALLKVILETGELADANLIRDAAGLAIAEGADFVKTSTGKTPVSATPDAVEIMLDVISRAGRSVGIKPSGGIRTAADAEFYLGRAEELMGADAVSAATFRFGASGLLDALVAEIDGATADESTATY